MGSSTEAPLEDGTPHNGIRNGARAPLHRTPSSPMMPAFMVSAPGKVIVFGEHAVVHGKVRQLYHLLVRL